jgi:hypothetical protein
MTARDVARTITEAFRDTPRPTGKLTDTYDDEGVEAYFAGRPWSGHDVASLRRHSAAMSFFTPEAFRYYLPAFMLAELADPETADIIGESIVHHFGPPEDNWKDIHRARLSLFTTPENDAVLAFLHYMESTDSAFSGAVRYAETQMASAFIRS